MASSATTFKSLAVFFVVFVFAAMASAQDGLSPAPVPGPDAGAPAPGPDAGAPVPGLKAGAAGSVSSSVAMIGASIVLSMFVILKH